MPQLCMRDLSAKADTSESTSKASGSQLVRHKPRADAGLRWDQGYLYTSKINEGFGSLRQTVPRTDVGTCQGPRWQFHRRGSPWARWAQPPESLLTASQATIPLLLSPNWMVTPEVKGKRGVNEGSGKAPWGAEHRNSPKGELVAAGLGATEQNQEESRVGRAKQNVRQGGGEMWSPRGSLGARCKLCWKQSPSEVMSGMESKRESPGVRWWLQLVCCDTLDPQGSQQSQTEKTRRGKSFKRFNPWWQVVLGQATSKWKRGQTTLFVRVMSSQKNSRWFKYQGPEYQGQAADTASSQARAGTVFASALNCIGYLSPQAQTWCPVAPQLGTTAGVEWTRLEGERRQAAQGTAEKTASTKAVPCHASRRSAGLRAGWASVQHRISTAPKLGKRRTPRSQRWDVPPAAPVPRGPTRGVQANPRVSEGHGGPHKSIRGRTGVHSSLPISLTVDWQICSPVWKLFFPPTLFSWMWFWQLVPW